MRRLTTSLVFLLLASVSIVGGGGNHVKLLTETVYPLQYASIDPRTGNLGKSETNCTTFSVNAKHRGWLTAAHCVLEDDFRTLAAQEFFIDGHPAFILEINVKHDLALLQTRDWGIKTSLKLAKKAPVQSDIVETQGYAWGLKKPFYFFGLVSQVDFDLEDGVVVNLANMPGIGGMSGGPVIDHQGRVVGVVHLHVGNGRILGFTPFSVLKKYDRGWVFER